MRSVISGTESNSDELEVGVIRECPAPDASHIDDVRARRGNLVASGPPIWAGKTVRTFSSDVPSDQHTWSSLCKSHGFLSLKCSLHATVAL